MRGYGSSWGSQYPPHRSPDRVCPRTPGALADQHRAVCRLRWKGTPVGHEPCPALAEVLDSNRGARKAHGRVDGETEIRQTVLAGRQGQIIDRPDAKASAPAFEIPFEPLSGRKAAGGDRFEHEAGRSVPLQGQIDEVDGHGVGQGHRHDDLAPARCLLDVRDRDGPPPRSREA